MKAAFLLDKENYHRIYSKETIENISKMVELKGRFDIKDILNDELKDVEVVFSGWGGIQINDEVISHMPNLKLVLYGAGSIKRIQTKEMWESGIRISSASEMNAIPVAEYCYSVIQLSSKNFFRYINSNNEKVDVYQEVKGFYNRKIGIISYSKVGKKLIELLESTNNEIYLYDPYIKDSIKQKINVNTVGLDYIFENCDIISLNSPLLPETENMINYKLLSLMKEDSVFINTARGKIVNHTDLEKVAAERNDITFILDVTYPEPLPSSSILNKLKNVLLTPHIAGSLGDEIYLMGDAMYKELKLYLQSNSLQFEITKKEFERMA